MGQTSSTPSTSPSSSAMRSGRRTTTSSGTSSQPSPTTQHTRQTATATAHSNSSNNSSSTSGDNHNLTHQQPSPPQLLQQPSSSPSRVLRSTTERRRRSNLFSSFYPLLSRSSSTPNSATASGSSQSQTSASVVGGATNVITAVNNAGNNAASSRGRVTRTEWPASGSGSTVNTSPGPVSRSATRSPGLQPLSSASSSRTPRGLSRVQRMYDEQSIRSTRSSSKESSTVATNPPVHASVNPTALPNSVEYMDVDMESADVAPQPQSSAAEGSVQPSLSYESQIQMSSSVQPDHAIVSTTEQPPPARTFTALRSGTTRTTQEPTSSTSSTADNSSLYTVLSNPRGGTSISSSLLPIRPDSDDDDDMEHAVANDHGISVAQGNTRPRRNFDPAVVADLIHDQIVQSLREAANIVHPSTEQAPSESIETLRNTHEHHHHHQDMDSSFNTQASTNGYPETSSSSGLNLQGDAPIDRVRETLHRRRLRSSSMRGLLGFQPTDELTVDERPTSQSSSPESTADAGADVPTEGDARPSNGVDRSQFLLNQLPFFIRLIADLSRSIRSPNGTDGQDQERPTDSGENSPTLASSDSGSADTDATTASETETPSGSSTSPPESGTEARPRQRTTVRLIQIAGGSAARHRARNAAANANGSENGEGGRTGEDAGEAVIMLFAGSSEDYQAGADSGDSPNTNNTETGRARRRHLSPWVVMTLSGSSLNQLDLSSLMAAAAGGEGGANYDDLWTLANLIGPARPVTTSQEAIDNAGFPVGQFEHAVQGMRNITTLGDGTKCLVCMSEYEEGENMRALKCKHGFHQECIDKWLTTGANKCPICRAAAVVTEAESRAADTEGSIHAAL